MRAAASRTFCTAGSSKPMRIAMIAITTNNSISVKPRRHRERTSRDMVPSYGEKKEEWDERESEPMRLGAWLKGASIPDYLGRQTLNSDDDQTIRQMCADSGSPLSRC